MKFNRVILIVLDSLGVGALPDAARYGDDGANTIGNLSGAVGGLHIPLLEQFGMGNITDIQGVNRVENSMAYWAKAAEMSVGKDTMTGHWEIMGIRTTEPMKTFTDTGFPQELITELEQKTGRKCIGNIAASGTEIVRDLGERHMQTGALILYTSADSVLQIAAHEGIVPPGRTVPDMPDSQRHHHGSCVAGGPGDRTAPLRENPNIFVRTSGRHDYALSPPGKTMLDYLAEVWV